MPIHERDRIRFHGWLVDHDLDSELADAILATMPPYDWHELATKTDLGVLEQRMDAGFTRAEERTDTKFSLLEERMDTRFTLMEDRFETRATLVDGRFDGIDRRLDGMDKRFDGVDRRLDNIETRMGGMAQEVHAILFTMIGLIVSILLASGAVMLA